MKWTLKEFYKDKISDEEAQDQLNLLDNNGDGEISYTEWRKFIHKHILKILLHWLIFIYICYFKVCMHLIKYFEKKMTLFILFTELLYLGQVCLVVANHLFDGH